MLPVLSAAQVRSLESRAMERDGLGALNLMERAGRACTDRIIQLLRAGVFGPLDRFVVLVGMGNNGGDGLVIARLLHQAGHEVGVVRFKHRSFATPENLKNLVLAQEVGIKVIDIDHSNWLSDLSDDQIIIDSVFGAGLTRPPMGWIAEVFAGINATGRPVIAIDLPSGLVAPEDGAKFIPEACIRASHTLTFEVPRLGLLLSDTGAFVGRSELIPIGLLAGSEVFPDRSADLIGFQDVRKFLRARPRFGHKGTFGHALVCAGSQGMYGAAVLAIKAALRSGVGLVTGHLPGEAAMSLLSVAPDAIASADTCAGHLSGVSVLGDFSAIGLGPGLGKHPDTAVALFGVLERAEVPVLLDADALNLLAAQPDRLALLGPGHVLTPHPKEMDRLLGRASSSSYERLRLTQAYAVRHRCTVVLKGAYTATCTADGRVSFNSSGNQGLAKGGSGDVLAGLLTGLLAQGYPVEEACLVGVFLHGLAGDLAARGLGMDAMRPSDVIEALPEAWKRLREGSEESFQ